MAGLRKTVTMADVARVAGVSITTVSHVLNRTRPVAESTELAVMNAVAEAGYVTDEVLRSRNGSSGTVGLAMSAMSNPYFAEVVYSLEQVTSRAGVSLLLADTHDEPATELRAISDLLSRRVDAVILAPSAHPDNALLLARQQNVPVVLIDRLIDVELDQVAVENEEPTAQLVDHLAELGHRRIAMICGKPGLSTTEERVAGYRLGLRRNRLRFARRYLVCGDSTEAGGQTALRILLDLPDRPSALVVGNNQMTIGVMRGAWASVVRIPEDLAVTGFDDFPWADAFHPGLTTIAQPTRAMGEQAAELALSRLASPSLPARRIQMHTTFMHRESCGCPLT